MKQRTFARSRSARGLLRLRTNRVRPCGRTTTEPSKIKAKKGEKVRLVVTRKTDATCAKEIVVKDQGIDQPLPLQKTVTVEFTPTKSGEIGYACAMDHAGGVVFIP